MNQTHVIKTLISVRKKKTSSHSLWSMDAGTKIVGLADRRRYKTLAKKDAYGSKYKLVSFRLVSFTISKSLKQPVQGKATTF